MAKRLARWLGNGCRAAAVPADRRPSDLFSRFVASIHGMAPCVSSAGEAASALAYPSGQARAADHPAAALARRQPASAAAGQAAGRSSGRRCRGRVHPAAASPPADEARACRRWRRLTSSRIPSIRNAAFSSRGRLAAIMPGTTKKTGMPDHLEMAWHACFLLESVRLQVAYRLMNQVEQLLKAGLLGAAECNPQIGLSESDRADSVFVQETLAHLFRTDADEAQAHEITGIERIIRPVAVVAAAVQQLLDAVGASLHNGVFLRSLGFEIRGAQSTEHKGLRRMRAAGDRRADDAHRLLLQRGQNLGGIRGVGDEAHPESPDVFFLGGAVHLDGQDALMDSGEAAEQRFMDGILEEQAEVGVVRNGNDEDAFVGGRLEGGDDFPAFIRAGSVAGRIVREVQDDDRLAFVPLGEQRLAQAVGIEASFGGVERVFHDFGSAADAEGELVVLPVFIRYDDRIPGIGEQIGHDAQAMSESVGRDGIAERLGGEGRIVLDHLLAPCGPQLRLAGRRSVFVQILRLIGRQRFLDSLQVHRSSAFRCDSDRGVELRGFGLGLGGLAENAFLRKIKLASQA
ncbi:hypothetical protein BN871_DV_00020 [Paenibacillus sp. P22]|nr:hypothetical protein BN871_DV_00020 [Paenibacillus sp. P22]